ncbi:hypothetical protein [Amycolatopsis sp. MEPSY49]|uniref:hypothetical protein n=1 Tax=Amycolatopsis sp. MEPSY49 TaxID=3151600 RepID=UPI003EF1F6DD
MTAPDRQDVASDAMLGVESRRDTLDARRDEFTSGVAARTQQRRGSELGAHHTTDRVGGPAVARWFRARHRAVKDPGELEFA